MIGYFIETNSKALFVATKHGGHLGFYECQEGSRFFSRGTYTWLDRAIIEYVQAALLVVGIYRTTKDEDMKAVNKSTSLGCVEDCAVKRPTRMASVV